MFSDFHVHSIYSDGKDGLEDIVRTAVTMGMPRLGFSDHSYAEYYEQYCMREADRRRYMAEIRELREKYRGQIELYCGIEQEFYGPDDTEGFDYVIGSVHFLPLGGEYFEVDWTGERIIQASDKYFGGDTMVFAEEYYRAVAQVVEKTRCDIIGHFDLVCKLNDGERLFDTGSRRYRRAWRAAADRLLDSGRPFEINTGAISRGYKSEPYPAPEITRYLADNGAQFILSSDAHRREDVCFQFERWKREYEALGAKIIQFAPGENSSSAVPRSNSDMQ